MSTIRVANVHFESTGTNRIDYLNDNKIRISSANSVVVTGNVSIGTSDIVGHGKVSIAQNDTAISLGESVDISGEAALSFWSNSISNRTTSNSFTMGMDSGAIGGPGAFIWNRNPAYIKFGTNNTERMRIDASGNVGVGISSPTKSLDVVGQFRVRGANPSGYALIEYGNSGTASQNWHSGSEGDGTFRWYNGNFGSGTERMRIDSSGRVTLPYQPTFHAGGGTAGGSNVLTQTSPTIIIWTVAVTNIGNHYNTSTGLFTAPVAGVYRFDYQLQQRFSGGFQIWWYKNGAALYRSGYCGSVSNDDGPGMSSSITVSLAANDTFAVWGARIASPADAYLGGNGNYDIAYFSGRLLG